MESVEISILFKCGFFEFGLTIERGIVDDSKQTIFDNEVMFFDLSKHGFKGLIDCQICLKDTPTDAAVSLLRLSEKFLRRFK